MQYITYDFGAGANSGTVKMVVNPDGLLCVPMPSRSEVFVFDVNNAGGEFLLPYAPVAVPNYPTWCQWNPMPTHPYYKYFYVQEQAGNVIHIINPANGATVATISTGIAFNYKFIFVETTPGSGLWRIWVIGNGNTIEIYDIDGTLITAVDLGVQPSDICEYATKGTVVISTNSQSQQLLMIRSSDYKILVPGYVFDPAALSGPSDMVFNPNEDRILAATNTTTPPGYIAIQYSEDTLLVDEELISDCGEPVVTEFTDVLADGDDFLQKCEECIQLKEAPCENETIIVGHLDPETFYYYTIIDKFGNKYTGGNTTDTQGSLTLELTGTNGILPDGSTTRWSGPYEIQILTQPLAPFAEIVNVNGKLSDCIILTKTVFLQQPIPLLLPDT